MEHFAYCHRRQDIRLHKDPTSQRSDFTKTLYTWYVPHCRVMVSHVLLSLCTPSRLLPVAFCSLTFVFCSLTFAFFSLTFAFCSLTFAHFCVLFTHFCVLFVAPTHICLFSSLTFVRDSPVVRTELKRQYSVSKLRVEPANETMR